MPNQTVTIAQALASNASSLQVLDTAANIAGALPNASLVARCAGFTLSAAATLGAAAADKLATLGGLFHLGGVALTVLDTVANMISAANAGGLALATTRQIEDAAYNLLNTPSSTFTNISSVILTGAPVLSMVQLTKLEALPNFAVASGSHLILLDALSAYIPVLSAHPGYFASATSVTVRLDGTQIGAAGVTSLATLASAGKSVNFVAGGSDSVLNVTASAQDLANAAASVNQVGALIGLHITLSNDGSAVTASVAAALISITAFSPAAHTLSISDTGAALTTLAAAVFGHGFAQIVVASGNFTGTAAELVDPALHLNSGVTVSMTGTAAVTCQQAAALEALPGFALASGASLTVSDTIANILTHTSVLGLASAVTVTDSETVSAANAGLLAQVAAAHPGQFSLGGHSLTVSDTAANLANLTPQTIALATGFALSASGTVTAARFTTLRDTLHVALGGNTLTIADTAAQLLGLSGNLTLAAATVLTGPASVSAANLTTLAAMPGFSTGGFALTVHDSAANVALNEAAILQITGPAATVSLTDTAPVLAATAAALDPVLSHLAAGTVLAVTDSATGIVSAASSLAQLGGVLGTLTLAGGTTVTAAQAAALLPLQSHLGLGVQLTVTGNAAAILANQAALTTLHTDNRLASVTDSADTAADVAGAGAVAALNAVGASVTIADTQSAVLGAMSALVQVNGLTAVHITDVTNPIFTLSSIATYAADKHVLSLVTNTHSIAISDTAAAIATDLASPSSVLTGITGSWTITPLSGAPLVLSQAVALTPAVAAILPHLVGSLQVTGVDLAHLGAVMALSPVPQSVTITDSAADIQADLLSGNSALLANLAHISAITVSPSGTITLDATHALATHVDDSPTSVFGLLTGATLAVTGATVAQVAGLEALHTPPLAISISDLAAAITAALTTPGSALLTSPATIVALHVSDGQPVVLTEAQDMATGVNVANAALTHLSGGGLDVTGVSVGQLAAVEGTAERPTLIAISDTGAAISAAVPALLGDLSNLGPISISAGVVTLSAAQAQMANVADGPSSLVSLLPSHSYAVTGATIAQIPQLLALAIPPASIAVTDSSANLVTDLLSGSSQWAAHSNNVTVTGGTLTLTDLQAETLGALGLNAHLGALVTGTTVDITGVPVSDLVAFAGLHANLVGNNNTLHLELADTALALATDLALGNPAETQASAYINSTTLTAAGGTLTAAQVAAVAGIPGLMTNGVGVQVQDTAAAIVGLSYAARDLLVAGTAVLDTAAHVQTELDSLQTRYNGGLTITLTDQNPSLTVTAATYGADHTTIEQITNLHCLTVTGTAAQIAAIEPSLAADTHVAAVQISDSAFNVVTNLTSIAALGSIATVTLTDSVISAALASTLVAMNLPNINYGSVVVADTGGQIAAMAESGGAAYNFLVAQGAELTGTSNVALADAVALTGISGHLNLNGQTVHIWDTAAHLLQPGALAAAQALLTTNGGLATGIYLKATGDAVTLTAANAATLLTTSGLSISNPDGSTNHLTVSDTASQLDSHFATLNADLGSLGAYVVNASTAVNDATLIDLQTLGATAGSGITLTLSDTASNIYTASLVGGASIHATSFALNANAAGISTTQAVALGGLTNFSAGGYTITVTLGSNTTLTSAQANNLGSLGAALVVAGPGEYTISGSAAALNGLTAAGATVAHVTLSDTLANIAALAPTSPLLSGAISVTDSEGLNATQATSLLALLTTPGVASGGITFNGNVETVTDTVAALQTLTASTAWTGNPGLRSHFALTAEDTVANLTNPANATFLNALPHQVLSANSMVNAGTAASLAALSHFSVGSSTLLLSDTAANLALPANSAGLALATSVTLSAASTVNAAGAETLLSLSTLHLNGSQPLTITDTPANLLDGTLSGLLASHQYVQVSLSGAQTLDAQTATALVALYGFSDPTDMHIVDSSSYLLAASASPAEAMAASVSLAGNETVSANTVLRLSEVPHFTDSGGILTLAGTDFANAPTLQAIADLGANFSEGGHSLILTQSDLALTAAEFTALTNDGGVVANGFQISAMLTPTGETDTNNLLSVTASGVSGATLHVYGGTGAPASSTVEGSSGSFIVTVPDSGTGANANFSITETVNGVESAPVVVLDQAALETAVSQAMGTFASSGEIQVDTGKYINLYTAASNLVLPNAPALVYNPVSHTISLDVPNAQAITLITLGASTSPASLEISEILIKHHS